MVSNVKNINLFKLVLLIKIFLFYFSSEIFKDSLINLTTNYIESIAKINEKFTDKLVINFITELEIESWLKHSTAIVFYGEVITGNLYSSNLIHKGEIFSKFFKINLCDISFEDNTHKCMKWATIITKILNNLTSTAIELPEVTDILLNLSYAATLGEIYIKHYSSVS